MGICLKLSVFVIVGVAILVGLCLKCHLTEMEVPTLVESYWGLENAESDDISVRPFKINIPDKILVDLKDRLTKAREFIPPLQNIQQQYGMNTNLLKEVIEYWRTKYNWRSRETFLNQYAQYKTKIQGLDIHFIHVKPTVGKNVQILPLLLAHGWPGSVREFYEIIPHLTTPQKGRNYVFEVVIPSLPGYGFSDAAKKPGMSPMEISTIFKNLMWRLGHQQFYLQGGDWGSLITANLAAVYKDHVLGVHSNWCFVNSPSGNLKILIGSLWPSLIVDKKYESRMYPLTKIFQKILLETGYLHLQSTKPDTIGAVLNDSPIGLAAYILEKFTTGTNIEWQERTDGGLKEKFTFDQLLDNVMIYWVTNSITTSMRLYAEGFNSDYYHANYDSIPIKVPSACAQFKYELAYTPQCILKERYQVLLQHNHFDFGGHFIAFEEPKALADDVYAFVDKVMEIRKSEKQK